MIELSKANETKIGLARIALMNKDIEEVDHQSDRPKVAILYPKELQAQGTATKKPIRVVFERLTHKMAQY